MFGFKKNPYRDLERKLGYTFKDKSLLEAALIHPSHRFETPGLDADNQRLEFLGDAILGMVAASHIFRRFEEHDEGVLTALRSRLTSGKALAGLARSIELGPSLRLGRGEEKSGGRQRASILADALEAVLGAAYLDGGYRAADKIFAHLFLPLLDTGHSDPWHDNPKGRLQELAQREGGAEPRYRLVDETGPLHARVYTIEVLVRGRICGRGVGGSKRAAETSAATEALRGWPAGGPSAPPEP